MAQYDRLHATKSVNAKLGLYIHLAVYILVNAGLVAVNLLTSPDKLWFQWPMIGWGAGLLFHAVAIYAFPKCGAVKERMIASEMRKGAGA